MVSLFRYVSPASPCGYLPDQEWSLEHEQVLALSKEEYLGRMLENWRRFGTVMFRPVCTHCRACQALRVPVERFRPDRSQRRARKANEGEVELRVGAPAVSRAKLALYDRYHSFQTDAKGWPQRPARDRASYVDAFVQQPFPVEEWCYYLGNRLVGVGYADVLPPTLALPAGGLSAIYFYYEPDERQRSLGTWNVLCLIEEARRRRLPYVYLGYFVPGCRSLAYKARFRPNEARQPDGAWRELFG